MHMGAGLALGVDPARLVPGLLHHRLELAVLGHRDHHQAAARVGLDRVVGHEQITLVLAEAGVGRLVTLAGHLVEGLDLAFCTDAETAGMAVRGFIDREQLALIGRQYQPRRADTLHHLLRRRVDMAGLFVKLIAVDALAGAIGVTAHQQGGGVGVEGHAHQASGQQARPDPIHLRHHPGHERHSYRLADARRWHRRVATRHPRRWQQ
ncbi:hypothetical protein D3C76_994240 [compost metagenome]